MHASHRIVRKNGEFAMSRLFGKADKWWSYQAWLRVLDSLGIQSGIFSRHPSTNRHKVASVDRFSSTLPQMLGDGRWPPVNIWWKESDFNSSRSHRMAIPHLFWKPVLVGEAGFTSAIFASIPLIFFMNLTSFFCKNQAVYPASAGRGRVYGLVPPLVVLSLAS